MNDRATERPSAPRRERFLDATRGVAMLLVLLAHFRWIYLDRPPGVWFGPAMNLVTMVAAPTFMLMSGLLLGFVYEARPLRFPAFRVKLVDRGLFLLTIGHVIITLAYVRYGGGLRGALHHGQILDAIGVALILGPWLVERVRPAPRLALGAALVLGAWLALYALPPAGPLAARLVKDTLVGGGEFWSFSFPVVPWLGLYLAGTVVGQAVATRMATHGPVGVRTLLIRCGVSSIVLALSLKVAGPLVVHADPGTTGAFLAKMTSPSQNLPPAPAYFLFYAGAGLLLMALVLTVDLHPRASQWLAMPAMLGRNSLFIFLLQEHIYVLVLWSLDLPYVWWWPAIFLVTATIAVAVTAWWDSSGFGRFLTVGYGRLWGPNRQLGQPAGTA